MKPYEFTRFYHPKLGRFVYKHKGSGIIVDNILKPMKRAVSSIVQKFAKSVAKKALETGISKTGEKLGKKLSEKSGDLIMKKIAKARAQPTIQKITPKNAESTDMILNRLISGSGKKKLN